MPPIVHIVDDDALIRASASFVLSGGGYATEIYADGPEFLAEGKLREGCILLDVVMPGMSGHEVQRELTTRGIALPVIMISGADDLKSAVQAMKLGAVDFLQKPVRDEKLLEAVANALELSGATEQSHETKFAASAALRHLSARELETLQGLLGGSSNKEIAQRLDLSPRTVEMHRARMMDSLGVSSLSEALRIAIDAGLEPLEGG